MAFSFLCGLVVTAAALLLTLAFRNYKTNEEAKSSKLPPGTTGWPLIGETLAFVTSPERFIQERMKRHSPDVFQTSVAGERMAVLCGPSAHKFIFSNEAKLFKPWWPRSVSENLIFPLTPDTMRLMEDHSFLRLDSMQKRVSTVDSVAREHLEEHWAPYAEVKAHPLSKKLTFALACNTFIGFSDPAQVRELAGPFFAVASGIFSAPVNVPGTPFNAAVRGGAAVKQKLVEIIRRRREGARGGGGGSSEVQDLLTRLLAACAEEGKSSSEKEKDIATKIISYLIASFYTTSSAITFALSHLADHPHVYERVLLEQREIARSKQAGELLTWEDVQKMKYSWNAVCESMRLEPPGQGGFKEVTTGFSFAGFHIPKGWKVFWTVHSTGKDPRYFPDPERFDPARFEGSGPPPYTFTPFGGGPRMCPGREYARMGILVFLHNVVTRFRLKKANPNEKVRYNPEPVPAEGLRLCLQPH